MVGSSVEGNRGGLYGPHFASATERSSPGRNAPGGIARGVVGIARSRGRRIAKGEAKVRPRTRRRRPSGQAVRSEEHTSELQSLMRISYAVFCLKKKKKLKTTSGHRQRMNRQRHTCSI